MKLLFVYNRHAGKDRNWAGLADILNTMTAAGYLVTAYPTQCAGDASVAIRRFGADYDRIVVAGGDGTLNDAVSGLIDLENPPPLGYIPVGSTNDFAKNLSLPSGLIELAATAVAGVPRPCDACRFNGRPFVYVAAFGAFTDVSFSTPQSTKNLFGYTAYLLESVKRLPSIKPYDITVHFEGGSLSGSYIYGMVSNTTSVAGLPHFPPGRPQLDDGLLEVTLISPPRDILELEYLGRNLLLGGPISDSPMLHSFTAAKVEIHCEKELLWTLDGENGGLHQVAEIEAVHRAFTIIHGA